MLQSLWFFFKFYLIHAATVDQDFSKENIHKLPSLVGLRGRGGGLAPYSSTCITPIETDPSTGYDWEYVIWYQCVVLLVNELNLIYYPRACTFSISLAIYIFVIGLLLFWPRYFGLHGVRIIVVTSLYMWLYDKVRSN